MTWTDEIEREYQRVAPQLGALIKNHDRASCDGEFPGTLAGLAALVKSSLMQDLLHTDPRAFRVKLLDFILDRELLKNGHCTPTEVATWSHQLESLSSPASRQPVITKALSHIEALPRLWEFERTAQGLDGLLHSIEMQQLERDRPALWRQHYLDFFAALEPAPTPQEVSAKRLELERAHPDDPALGMVAKALVDRNRLTHGQSVLVQNFGEALGDPAQWLRSRS